VQQQPTKTILGIEATTVTEEIVMTENPRPGTTTVLPFTRYKDASAAIEWLCAAFGFQRQLIAPAPGGTIAHAELSFGPALFALATERDDVLRLCSPRDVGCVTQGVYFYVEDVDAISSGPRPQARKSFARSKTPTTTLGSTAQGIRKDTSGASERTCRVPARDGT